MSLKVGREKGPEQCYGPALLPSIICLGRLHIASKYSISDNCVRESTLCSVVRPLDFYPGGPSSNPMDGGKFFQLCLIPLLRLSCCKMGARPR